MLLEEVDELLNLFLQLYGEYSSEAINTLNELETDLKVIAGSLTEINYPSCIHQAVSWASSRCWSISTRPSSNHNTAGRGAKL